MSGSPNFGEIMKTEIEKMEDFLKWLKTCPLTNRITSMQNDFIHVKFYVGKDEKYMETENNE